MEVITTPKIQYDMYITKKDILSALAYWGVQLCTTRVPFNLEQVLIEAEKTMREEFSGFSYGQRAFNTRKEVFELVNKLQKIPILRKWNLTRKEYDAFIDPDSPERPQFSFKSSFDAYHEYSDDDFIDLDALVRNVANMVCDLAIKNSH